MNLVVGATGYLGTEICIQLRARGEAVRALVRTSSDPVRCESLRAAGVELFYGDLTDAASLSSACDGIDTVISTATVVRSQAPQDSFSAVDDAGQRALVAAAHANDVAHFIFISLSGNVNVECPLVDAKRRVEDYIRESGIGYTILRPSAFIEVWFGPIAGFDHAQRVGTMLGTGEQRLSYISQTDVARFAVAAALLPNATNGTFDLGGPAAVTPNDAVASFEQISGGKYEVQKVPVEALRAQYEAAEHPTQKSFAGIMLALAHDDIIPMAETSTRFGVEPQPFAAVARAMLRDVYPKLSMS